MKLSKTTWWIIGGSLVAVSGIGIYLLLSKKKEKAKRTKTTNIESGGVFSIDGGTTTAPSIQQKARVKQEPNWNRPFNYGYIDDLKTWFVPKKIQELPRDKALLYAKKLKEAKGFFDDDETVVGEVFTKLLRDKSQVSSVSRAFFDTYKKDLWQHLHSFLSSSELKTLVSNPVRKLPNYTLKR